MGVKEAMKKGENSWEFGIYFCLANIHLPSSQILNSMNGSELGLSVESNWSFLPPTCIKIYPRDKIKLMTNHVYVIWLPQKPMACLYMFLEHHKCYGTFKYDTLFQSLMNNACTSPLFQAFLSHRLLEAKWYCNSKTLITSII